METPPQIVSWIQLIITLVVTAVATFVITKYFDQRGRSKRLDYSIVYSVALLAFKPGSSQKKLEVTYNGKPIEEPWQHKICIENTGVLPISESEYHTAIFIRPKENAAVLNAKVLSSQPLSLTQDLKGAIEFFLEKVMVSGPFLNPGEYFEITVVTDGNPGQFSVESRIEGAFPMRKIESPTVENLQDFATTRTRE